MFAPVLRVGFDYVKARNKVILRLAPVIGQKTVSHGYSVPLKDEKEIRQKNGIRARKSMTKILLTIMKIIECVP